MIEVVSLVLGLTNLGVSALTLRLVLGLRRSDTPDAVPAPASPSERLAQDVESTLMVAGMGRSHRLPYGM